jgi:hypothetical protein
MGIKQENFLTELTELTEFFRTEGWEVRELGIGSWTWLDGTGYRQGKFLTELTEFLRL